MRVVSEDNFTISVESACASGGVLVSFLTLPVMGAVRSSSVVTIDMSVIASLSSSLTTSYLPYRVDLCRFSA